MADSDSEVVGKYHSERKAADTKLVGKRHSDRIKERMAAINVSTLKVSKVHTAPSLGPCMGSSCSVNLLN